MRVLVISHTAWPGYDGEEDGTLLMVARPHDALHGHRFDLIVAPAADHLDEAYKDWWVESVLCRLAPHGRIVTT